MPRPAQADPQSIQLRHAHGSPDRIQRRGAALKMEYVQTFGTDLVTVLLSRIRRTFFEGCLQRLNIRFNFLKECQGIGPGRSLGRTLIELLHGRHDDSDEQIENGECCNDNERDEKCPRPGIHFHHWPHDSHGPTFQRHDLKQGE